MATSTKTFGNLPLSTINPSKIGAQATPGFDTLFRPLQWLTPSIDENMQQPENDASLYSLLTLPSVASKDNDWTNPTIWWRVENRLAMATSLAKAVAAADTFISVAEVALVKTGYVLYLPQTGQQMLVTAVDADLSEGWVNNAADACNVTVSRTFLPGPALAASINQEVRAGVPMMGEFGEPKEGIQKVPGDPLYNFIQLFGLYIKMSRMQKNSLMAGDYGTQEHLVKENESYLAQQLQNTLLFGRRGTKNDSDEGMVYLTNGLIAQLKDNVLSAGSTGNTLTYQNVSEFIDQTHESANSSASKVCPVGERLYMNLLNTARQEAAIVGAPMYDPSLGVDSFSFSTAGGKTATVQKHRYAFQGQLKDWGLVLDMGNLATSEYKGFGWKWMTDLEAPMQGITTLTDALVGSIAVTVKDPDTCGVLMGGTAPVISNRNGLGIVETY